MVIFPSVDALDEFKLQTSTYAAEFGRSMGGVVNLQIKSGANQLHGGAFGFLRERRARRQQLLQQPGGIAQARLQARPVRRAPWADPSARTGPSSSPTTRGTRIDQGVNRRLHRALGRRCATGISPRSTAPIYDPLTGQPFPGNVIPPRALGSAPRANDHGRSSSPRPNTAGQARRQRPDPQQLRDQPQPRAAGRPVRREGRPRPEREQPLLRPLQLPEEPPLPAPGPAPGRRRHAPETAPSRPRASPSTTPTPSVRAGSTSCALGYSSFDLNGRPDRLRREPRGRRWASPASTSTTTPRA